MADLKTRNRIFGWGLVAPALILILFLIVYPFGDLIYLSFRNWNPLIGVNTYFGLGNYHLLSIDPSLHQIMGQTVVYLITVIPTMFIVSLLMALLFTKPFKGQVIVISLVMIPFMFASAVVGDLWKIMLQPYGYLNFVMNHLGLQSGNWLEKTFGSASGVMFWIDLAIVWKYTPLVFLILLTGFKAVPGELYDAAQVDGLSKFRQFTTITLPLSRTTVFLGLLFTFVFPLKDFGIVYSMTGGFPGIYTATLPFYIYLTGVDLTAPHAGFGYASAQSILLLVLVGVIVIVLNMITRGQRMEGQYEQHD